MKVKLWLARRWYRVALFWWCIWSASYRWLYQRKYKGVKLDVALSASDVMLRFGKMRWSADGAKELWDTCSSPQWVQHVVNNVMAGNAQPEGPLDCDEFAIWAAHVLRTDYNPSILTVAYIVDGKIKGHALCMLLPKFLKLSHLSNWGRYGGYSSLFGVIASVLEIRGAEDLVGWGVLDTNLRVMRWGTELP